MPVPASVNAKRAEEASKRDVAIAQQILANTALYQRLTLSQRAVLLKRVENPGWSWAQVAEALNLTKSAAWARWQRAVAILDGYQDESSDTNLWNMGQ